MEITNTEYVTNFKGIPFVEVPQESDKTLIFFFDTEKYSPEDAREFFKYLKKEFPKRHVIGLMDSCKIEERDLEELQSLSEWLQDVIKCREDELEVARNMNLEENFEERSGTL